MCVAGSCLVECKGFLMHFPHSPWKFLKSLSPPLVSLFAERHEATRKLKSEFRVLLKPSTMMSCTKRLSMWRCEKHWDLASMTWDPKAKLRQIESQILSRAKKFFEREEKTEKVNRSEVFEETQTANRNKQKRDYVRVDENKAMRCEKEERRRRPSHEQQHKKASKMILDCDRVGSLLWIRRGAPARFGFPVNSFYLAAILLETLRFASIIVLAMLKMEMQNSIA